MCKQRPEPLTPAVHLRAAGSVFHGEASPRTPLSHALLVLTLLLALLGGAAAQGAEAGTLTQPDVADAELVDAEETAGTLEGAPNAVFAVGLSAGFPAYQTVALAASLQAQYVGVQLKGSWTPVGAFVGGQLRAYPPVPVPVPLYLGVGGGLYGSDLSYHVALGGHVPLGKNLRLDLEGGVANVPLLDERTWAPHVAVGVSYAFPVELTPITGAERSGLERRSELQTVRRCAEPTEPDPSLLRRAVDDTIDDWLRSAQATYGSVYSDLNYSYRVSSSVAGDTASVSVSYRGSVREILTGVRHRASGTAKATFLWTGCGWANTGVSY